MPLMAVASPHFPFPSSSTRHLRRAATAIAAATSSSGDFDYPLADPSVRWPNLSFPHLPAPRFPATVAPPAPVRPPQAEEDQRSAESTIASTSAAVEPLDARAHRTRVKKLSKLALRRAQDWRERVAGMADAILALPPGAPVDDVLDGARASADEVALVLRAVGERSWRRALDAFEWLARGGAPAPRAVAVVLGVLGRARQDAAAEEVFVRFAGDGATVQVFNAMMGVYARSGRFDDVRQLLDAMRDRGVEPDLVSFNTLINAMAKSGCLAAGVALDLLFEVRQAGLRPDVITYNTLISACSQSSNLEDALSVFEEMMASECRPDLWTYNTMVSVCGRCGKVQEAERLFTELLEKGFKPDAISYNSLLYAYAKEGDADNVERVCEELVKAGFTKNEITYNTMIHMYGKMGRLDLAIGLIAEAGTVLEEMVDAGLKPTLVTFSALICAYAKGGRQEEAEKTFDGMVESGVKPDRLAYLVMLDIFARSGETKKLMDLYRTMMKDSYRPDDGLYQVLLAALAKGDEGEVIEEVIHDMELVCQMSPQIISTILMKAGCIYQGSKLLKKGCIQGYEPDQSGLYEKARAVFDNMMKTGLLPTVESINGMMRALIVDDRLDELYVVVQQLQDMDFKISKSTVLLMLDAFARAGDVFEVMKIYNGMKAAGYLPKMKGAGLTPDLVILNALLMMYTVAGNFDRTEQIYHGILEGGLEPDEDTYNALIVMYCRSFRPEEGFTLLNEMDKRVMKEDGVEPTISTMHILMTSYGSAGHPHEAESVLNSLKASNMEVSTLPYSAVLDAYLKNGDYNLGITKLLEMKRDGVEPDHQVWTCFIRAASLCEQTDDAVLLLNSLQDCGFDLPLRLLTERTPALLTEVDNFLEELGALEDSAALNFVNALEDLLWAFERRATASWIFQLAAKRGIYHNIFRVIEKDWGADFRKLSAGAALVGLTLWLDHMQDASLQGSPEPPKSIVLVTGEGEYNRVY
ncbi:hypothetical protein QOZ80_6BG0464320 [Eleusine coracana subsp. coracana]|nr:hypothetical protein QOZ80_6BG0464320 [Eleusine coracana subsp. coracana]